MDNDNKGSVILENRFAVIELPIDSINVTIFVKVYNNDKIIDVTKIMSLEDIRDAFNKAERGYIDDDDVFTLTDEFRRQIEQDQLQGI